MKKTIKYYLEEANIAFKYIETNIDKKSANDMIWEISKLRGYLSQVQDKLAGIKQE